MDREHGRTAQAWLTTLAFTVAVGVLIVLASPDDRGRLPGGLFILIALVTALGVRKRAAHWKAGRAPTLQGSRLPLAFSAAVVGAGLVLAAFAIANR